MHRGQRASLGNKTDYAIKAGYKDAADFFASQHKFFLLPGRHPYKNPMPLYIIERNFAEQLELDADGVVAISRINGDVGVNWLFSFLSADKRKSYCLYEAKNPEAIREAARRANVPADVIVEVTQAFGSDPRALAAMAG